MLALAVFCMAVAAVPWPKKQPIDLAMWACFALVLLVVGAWQIDKAGKEALQASQLGETLFPSPPIEVTDPGHKAGQVTPSDLLAGPGAEREPLSNRSPV